MNLIATWIREVDTVFFQKVFARYPQVQLSNARTEKVAWDQVEGLLLTGGSDISEHFLRQPVPDPGIIEDPNPARDAWEFPALERTLEKKLPVLAICRGLQVLNVARGGTLHLHIPHHDSDKYENVQKLRYSKGVPIQFSQVNSSHHQALDRLGSGLIVEAWSAHDDVVEQAHLADYPFVLGVQYHPERDSLYQPLFDAFIQQLGGERL